MEKKQGGELLCICSVPPTGWLPRGAKGPGLKKSTATLEDKYIRVCQATREQGKMAGTMVMIASER